MYRCGNRPGRVPRHDRAGFTAPRHRGDRRAARRHRRDRRPQPGQRRRGARRRRRALSHGQLLQDPHHGRGHAAGRRRRAATRRPAHAERGRQEPREHADPLPRGTAPERARPPLPDDHPERQHGHRHALAAGRPRLRQRDDAPPRPRVHRLLHAQPRVLPHRVGRGRGVGGPQRPRDRRPLAGDRGARGVRGRVPPRPRGERAPQRRRLPSPVRPPLGPGRVVRLRRLLRRRPGPRQPGHAARHGRPAGDDRAEHAAPRRRRAVSWSRS